MLQPQFHTGKNKAKTAILVAAEAKPEVEVWRQPKKSKEHWRLPIGTQTERQTTSDSKTTPCTVVHQAVKTLDFCIFPQI